MDRVEFPGTPCPFCGGTLLAQDTSHPPRTSCRRCGAQGPDRPAIITWGVDWHSRPAEAALRAQVLELEQRHQPAPPAG